MRKTRFCVIIFILLAVASVSLAVEGEWTRKADMPTARLAMRTSVVDGKIYAIGGIVDWLNGPVISTVEQYDPAKDEWVEKANMPTARHKLSTNTVNEMIYAIGGFGYGGLSIVERYDPISDTWSEKTPMPTERGAHASSVVNGKIYVMGGWSQEKYFSVVEEYDPIKDVWTEKAPMLVAKSDFATATVNGKIYAIGGVVGGGNSSVPLADVEEYNPVDDTWKKLPDMPSTRLVFGISVVNGKIYVIGGSPRAQNLSKVEEYDPIAGVWTEKSPMPTPRVNLATSAVNGRIYAIGGTSSNMGISVVEEYDTGLGMKVTDISPQEGPVAGGMPIAILGSDFLQGAEVTIGGKSLTQLNVKDSLITGIIPPGTEGEQDIEISVPDFNYSTTIGKFIYSLPSQVAVTVIRPTNGRQAGGEPGSISGSGFLPGTIVIVGENQATEVGVTTTLITLTIPPGTEGVKDVVVTNPDGQKATLRDAYTYNPLPVIGRIRPSHGGPLAGGTAITITGEHFMDGVVVNIGEKRVQKLNFFSPTELRLRTPPGEAGPKAVTVMNLDGQEAIKEDGFTYNPAPTISSISPAAGSLAGGTVITITGTGFLLGGDVLIGGVEASYVIQTSLTKIRAKTPPSDAGVKDVVVINADGQRATLKDAFTYNPAPVITKVIPDNGKLAGGTSIILQGSGFLPGAKVFFSTDTGTLMTAPSAQVMSGNIITAVTPLGKPGPKDVVVHNTDDQRVILTDGFTYNPLPTITHITPNNGGSSGGTKIIIGGTGFLQGVRVAVGGNAGTAQWQDEETIQVVTPSNPPGIWDVRVLNPDTQEVTAKRAFITVGETVYNFPNPFRASQGTTFRYMTRHQVQYMTIKIFNLEGSPVDVVEIHGSNEVKWHNPKVHIGLYVYLVEAELESGEKRHFRSMLEVYK